jgi:hypothetical protein
VVLIKKPAVVAVGLEEAGSECAECMEYHFGVRHGKGPAGSIAVMDVVVSAAFSVAKIDSSFFLLTLACS